LKVTTLIGLLPGAEIQRGDFADQFQRQQNLPSWQQSRVIYSVQPVCGCCQGQHAGQPFTRFTENDVTCEKCKPVRHAQHTDWETGEIKRRPIPN